MEGRKLIFDIETDGLLDELSKIHCIVIRDMETRETMSCTDNDSKYHSIEEGLSLLENARELVGHNIIDFDLKALKKVYPRFKTEAKITDTLVLSRLIYAHIEQVDWKIRFKGMPVNLYGRHSMEAWGYRLGFNKGEFSKETNWKKWSRQMQDYCLQDVDLNELLYDKINPNDYSQMAIEMEHDFFRLIAWQMEMGVPFNTEEANRLRDEIKPKMEETKLNIQEVIPPWVTYEEFTPKRNNKTKGYVKGQTIVRSHTKPFNPGSRQQIVKFLKKKYGWTPVEFTKKGNPVVGREVLEKLSDWEEVPLFLDYLDMSKLMGTLDTGENSWLNFVKNGRIHGRVITNGAVTGRCTHSNPNLAQVPAVRSYKGRESRGLFYAPEPYRMVGSDASQLELRMLGHYLFRYDGGKYAVEVDEGDIHTLNQEASGVPTRDDAKTFIYAYNYGAGDVKLGSIVEPKASEDRQRIIGRDLRRSFESKVPAIKRLIRDIKSTVNRRGFLVGLDGRRLFPRSDHKGLNTLLQGAGACVMKKAPLIKWETILERGIDAYPALHVHDETQDIVIKDKAEEVGKLAAESITLAGEFFKLNVVLKGDYQIGSNWAETH